jgi:hypothetical protein
MGFNYFIAHCGAITILIYTFLKIKKENRFDKFSIIV